MTAGVELERYLDAVPERVFAAFADARLVARWLKPLPEIRLSVLEFDFRKGGSYRFAYYVPGATDPMIVCGCYSLIEPPSRIVFSWIIEPPDAHAGIPSEVTVTIRAAGERTVLRIRHDRWTRPDAEQRHAAGWQGALDQLAALLKSE